MRVQELKDRDASRIAALVIFPHEGSGAVRYGDDDDDGRVIFPHEGSGGQSRVGHTTLRHGYLSP